ncbi:MAG: efflux RND transporter periplasmic adaptor subunit [Fusobacterium sp.]|uniref:efflux RND transporter periplasmic adaptor subunit n=1 Tax=Fusobacterium sp. TaxID=68766 RepID=UPI0026DD8DE1|nr:efflux RND transporter periplasmic adaptor subunit [Fusobacterium sp.]MDO4690480.1 efflux RND transporter periplasmic adaptor subunit [Fusobacterium sp.]
MIKLINKKIIIGIVFLVLIYILYIFLRPNPNEKVYLEDYNYINAQKTNIIGTITLNGQISANNPIGIFVDKKLKVKEVTVKNGDFVEKDEVLVSFDDDEKNKIERSIEKENINLNKISRNLKTLRELYAIGGVSLEEVKTLEGDYRIVQLNLEELKETLSKTAKEIKSPVAGVISNLKAQKNYLVDTDSSLMEIIDSNDLKIVVEIPEYNSTMINLGDEVKIKLESTEDEKIYSGVISKISKLSMISSLTSENVLEAEVKASEDIPNLIPGFKIKATANLKDKLENIVIPKISLVYEEGKYFVFILKNENEIVKKEIEVKNVTGENVVVLSGLNVDEKIVKAPDNRLKDGLKLLKGEKSDKSREN